MSGKQGELCMIEMEVCEGKCMGHCPGNEPLTLTKCYSCEMPQHYKALEGGNPSVAKPTT